MLFPVMWRQQLWVIWQTFQDAKSKCYHSSRLKMTVCLHTMWSLLTLWSDVCVLWVGRCVGVVLLVAYFWPVQQDCQGWSPQRWHDNSERLKPWICLSVVGVNQTEGSRVVSGSSTGSDGPGPLLSHRISAGCLTFLRQSRWAKMHPVIRKDSISLLSSFL